jgi:hypothetical protein
MRAMRRGGSKDSSMVQITTPSKIIEPSESEQLLGCVLHQNMKFGEHLLHSDESVLRALNKRIGALKILGKVASFRTRKMVADGIFMSKLIYLITLWGGSAKYMIVALQKAQNRAARVVTKLDWYTPTAELLNQCGRLSVHQLVVYHSVVLVYKVIQNKSPKFLHSMFSAEYTYQTKQARDGMIRHTRDLDLGLTASSFRWRAARSFDELPLEIRKLETAQLFKKAAKAWIKQNIPLIPTE